MMFSLYLFAGVQQFPWESLFRRPRGRSPRTYGLDRRGSLSSSIDFKTLSRLGRVINLWTMSGAVVGSRSHYGAPVQGANEGCESVLLLYFAAVQPAVDSFRVKQRSWRLDQAPDCS